MGISVFSNLAFWIFFSITRFEPFSLTTFLSLGRLNAAVWTPLLPSPPEKDDIHYPNRRERTELWIAVLRIDRNVVLEFLQILAETFELVRLGIVADRYVGFERGFI